MLALLPISNLFSRSEKTVESLFRRNKLRLIGVMDASVGIEASRFFWTKICDGDGYDNDVVVIRK